MDIDALKEEISKRFKNDQVFESDNIFESEMLLCGTCPSDHIKRIYKTRKENAMRRGIDLIGIDNLLNCLNDVKEVNLISILSGGRTIIVFLDGKDESIIGYAGYI